MDGKTDKGEYAQNRNNLQSYMSLWIVGRFFQKSFEKSSDLPPEFILLVRAEISLQKIQFRKRGCSYFTAKKQKCQSRKFKATKRFYCRESERKNEKSKTKGKHSLRAVK